MASGLPQRDYMNIRNEARDIYQSMEVLENTVLDVCKDIEARQDPVEWEEGTFDEYDLYGRMEDLLAALMTVRQTFAKTLEDAGLDWVETE